jgi:hypothetical protein
MDKATFAAQYGGAATLASEQLGVPKDAIIALWALETGWGKSIIPGTNNLGNVKDFSGNGVEAIDNMTGSKDKYRKFDSDLAFAGDWSSLIKRKYPAALGAKTAQEFATALKAGGYAEDANYVEKVTTTAGELYTPTEPVKGPKQKYADIISAGVQASVMRPTSKVAFSAGLDTNAFEARVTEETRPSFLEKLGGAMSRNTDQRLIDGITEHLWRPEFEPVEGYTPDLKALPAGSSSDLIADYAGAKSPDEATKILKDAEDEAFRVKTVMDNGVVGGLAISFAAELGSVANIVAPMGVAKGLHILGKGSLTLAAEGRSAASIASAVGENLLGGTALEAVTQTIEGRVNGKDLAINAVMDSVMGLAFGAYGAATVKRVRSMAEASADSALSDVVRYAGRATQELGPNATASDIKKAMDAYFTEDLNAPIKSAVADVPTEAKFVSPDTAAKEDPIAAPTSFDNPKYATGVEARGTGDKAFGEKVSLGIFKATDDFDERKLQIDNLVSTPGVHLTEGVKDSLVMQRYAKALESLRSQLIPDVAIHFADVSGLGKGFEGVAGVIKPGVSLIAVKPGGGMRALVHELGHVVFQHKLAQAPDELKQAMYKAWEDWRGQYVKEGSAQAAMLGRSPVTAVADASRKAAYLPALEGKVASSLKDVFTPDVFGGDKAKAAKFADYFSNFDEFSAEQFVKHVESLALGETKGELSLPAMLIQSIKNIVESALAVFGKAKELKLIAPNASFNKFFDSLVAGDSKAGRQALNFEEPLSAMAVPAKPADVANEILTDPDAAKFGMTVVPVGTPAERKHAQAMLALHKQAEQWAAKNPMDASWEKRVQNLADNNVFNVASTGLLMLKSKSPLVRMIASELLEDASGAAGKRRNTAAISKYLMERMMLGNVTNDVEGAYKFWRAANGGSLLDDMIGGTTRARFDKALAQEIEARRASGSPVNPDPNIKAAVDSIEASYQRSADAQRKVGTLGADGLPTTSRGYMPHRMSAKAVLNMTNEQGRILHSVLTDQFVTIEGWDATFADKLASSYMKRVRDRAGGDYGSNVGGNSASTASLVEEALRGMDLPEDVIGQHMTKFSKGGANFTKGRIELDLNKVYQTPAGEFRLLDLFETNQLELLRSQVGRASGEVALTKHGVRGKPGLKLLRDALAYGEDGKRAGIPEKEAFDQMSAEFMNEPFGTHTGKFMERAMAANTLVRLGGIAFNQLAESINGIFHVGAGAVFDSLTSIGRLRGEIKDLVANKAVHNPFLTSIEHTGGAEFGTDAYKVVMPFDSPDHAYPTYGQDTLTLTDRLLRGGGHLQSKISGWRLIHSAQQRGMAEQIVKKIARYVNEGKDDVALRDFGITPDVQAALKQDLGKISQFDSAGNPLGFDATKISDPDIRDQVIQAVWRGTQQIIQGTFIGERGKWAHDGWLKMLTQFRTFSITSMEKQWGRQRNNHGSFAAFGMMMGAMSIAVPIYVARTYAASIGRPDQEEYLASNLTPMHVGRATLNYIAMSGMVGDFLDLTSSMLPEEMGITPTGGRAGVASDFVGNYVLPASSLVDDLWKYAQSPLDAHAAARVLPGSRLPYLLPLTNALKD